MFDYLKGLLVSKTQNQKSCYFTVEVGGIGYLLEVTQTDFNTKSIDDDVKIYTVLIHREDTMSLCGFLSKEARDIFNILTSVSGVGSKMALCLLNEFDVSDLIYFVINENSKELTKAKGVGTKLAQKIILELKDKLVNVSADMKISLSNSDMPDETVYIQNILLSLGYEEEEIINAIKQACLQGHNPKEQEDFLRVTLQILSV